MKLNINPQNVIITNIANEGQLEIVYRIAELSKCDYELIDNCTKCILTNGSFTTVQHLFARLTLGFSI